jgi:hypothetical protein
MFYPVDFTLKFLEAFAKRTVVQHICRPFLLLISDMFRTLYAFVNFKIVFFDRKRQLVVKIIPILSIKPWWKIAKTLQVKAFFIRFERHATLLVLCVISGSSKIQSVFDVLLISMSIVIAYTNPSDSERNRIENDNQAY